MSLSYLSMEGRQKDTSYFDNIYYEMVSAALHVNLKKYSIFSKPIFHDKIEKCELILPPNKIHPISKIWVCTRIRLRVDLPIFWPSC